MLLIETKKTTIEPKLYNVTSITTTIWNTHSTTGKTTSILKIKQNVTQNPISTTTSSKDIITGNIWIVWYEYVFSFGVLNKEILVLFLQNSLQSSQLKIFLWFNLMRQQLWVGITKARFLDRNDRRSCRKNLKR